MIRRYRRWPEIRRIHADEAPRVRELYREFVAELAERYPEDKIGTRLRELGAGPIFVYTDVRDRDEEPWRALGFERDVARLSLYPPDGEKAC